MSKYLESLSASRPKSRLVYEKNGITTEYTPLPEVSQLDISVKDKDVPLSSRIYCHISGCNILKHNGREAFLYDPIEKRYIKLSSKDWSYMIKLHLTPQSRHHALPKHCEEALQLLLTDPEAWMPFDTWRTNNPLKIACQNGIVDLEKRTIEEAGPDSPISVYFDFEYIPGACLSEAEAFMFFSRTSLDYSEEDAQSQELTTLILIIIGYILSGSRGWRRSFIGIGPSRCGKSVLADFINSVVTDDATSNIPIDQLGDKFSTAALDGKVLNLIRELPSTKLRKLEVFKSVVSNESVSCQKKHKDPDKMTPSCKILAFGNVMPELPNSGRDALDDAFYWRLLFIPFSHSIAEDDIKPNLLESLKSERNIICSVAIDYFYYGLHLKNYQTPKCLVSEQYMQQYRKENAVFETFVEEQIIFDKDAKLSMDSLLKHFSSYCQRNCYNNKINASEVVSYFAYKHSHQTEHARLRFPGNRTLRGFRGIKLRVDDVSSEGVP